MTVRLLCDWDDSRDGKRYKCGNLLTTDAGTEAGMVAAKLADVNLTGGTNYIAPAVEKQTFPVTAEVNQLTGGIEIRNLQNDGNNIAFIGDSRMRYGYRPWHKNITPDSSDGIEADWLGVGPGVTVDSSVGALEFRAADKAFRWTAPSDSAGQWVPATTGQMVIQSGSASKEIYFVLRSLTGLPTADQSISMTCTGTLYPRVEWTSVVTDVMSRYRNGPTPYYFGAGGALTAELSELAPWYSQAAGPGVDIIRIGTNDISNGSVSAAEMILNTTAFLTSRLSLGRKLVVCGEPARWGVNTSTAMTGQQLATLIAYNKGLRAFTEARASTCRYIDLYSISRDPGYIDGRPLSGMLVDTVHDGLVGTIAFSDVVKAAIDSLGGPLAAPYPMAGDTSVVFNNASTWMTGTAGTIGTGASGQAPTGIIVNRASGADLTIVSSIVSADGRQGKRVQLDLTSTTVGNIAQVSSELPSSTPTLATMGLAAGDVIEFEVDVEVVSGSPTSIIAFLNLPGTSRQLQIVFPTVAGKYHQKSPPLQLLAADTTIRQMAYITMPASSTASVRIGEFVTRRVVG